MYNNNLYLNARRRPLCLRFQIAVIAAKRTSWLIRKLRETLGGGVWPAS